MHLQHNLHNRRASERQHVTTADILSSIARNRHQIHANYQQQTCYLTKSLGSDISHCREHRDASVLQLGLAASLEVLHATIGGEAGSCTPSSFSNQVALVRNSGLVRRLPTASSDKEEECRERTTSSRKTAGTVGVPTSSRAAAQEAQCKSLVGLTRPPERSRSKLLVVRRKPKAMPCIRRRHGPLIEKLRSNPKFSCDQRLLKQNWASRKPGRERQGERC